MKSGWEQISHPFVSHVQPFSNAFQGLRARTGFGGRVSMAPMVSALFGSQYDRFLALIPISCSNVLTSFFSLGNRDAHLSRFDPYKTLIFFVGVWKANIMD